ncbi:hypothetical protein K505DRAFT_242919 [Melanomma pulvis-pyrius CBS 109.77]|uniref:Wbp11/ELF5/Saf1 N-terminal domain-containing protein n=1 Tax=Melanomma pulvis-pyrius CBS 109.77 TaxID=1314802 RepID=A0A6A6XDW1_9PLEO|nr:hypothetical protein K505DRAFT_242919 [Melanomma pulvis-pyrius CBS 109.77]
MAKEKNFNPVQAEKKAEKQKQIRKQKANVQAQRNEKLARRNPARIQRDIDSLKEADQSGGLRPHERQRLSELEKDLAAVNKARTALGDKAPQFRPERRDDEGNRGGRGGHRGGGVLGKRTRDGGWKGRDGGESSDTDADVKDIPMPRDTPPPLPRRPHRQSHAEETPPEPKKPILVYEAAPQVRDLRKEAVTFMPTSVAQKMKLAKGEGRLLEPDEFDKLQKEGYMNPAKPEKAAEPEGAGKPSEAAQLEDVVTEYDLLAYIEERSEQGRTEVVAEAAIHRIPEEDKIQDSIAESRVAWRKPRQVEIEEIDDEDL